MLRSVREHYRSLESIRKSDGAIRSVRAFGKILRVLLTIRVC